MSRGLDRRSTLFAAAIVLAVVGFISLVTGPQFRRIAAVKAQTRAERFELATGETSQEALAALRKQVDALEAESRRCATAVGGEEALGAFLQEIGRAAERQRLAPDLIQPGRPTRDEKLVMLPVTLKVRGMFTDIFGLIQAIEQLPRLTRFDRVSIQTDPERATTVIAEISLRVYFRTTTTEQGRT